MGCEANDVVLIVEDDAALRILLGGLLARKGWRVLEAGTREGALALLAENPSISVIVLDLGLTPRPHVIDEGILFLFSVRQSGFRGKVVVLTGQDQHAAAVAAIGEGAFDFLAKPAQPEQILAAVERARLFYEAERQLACAGQERVALSVPLERGWREIHDQVQELVLRRLWRECEGNASEVARRLGVKRENLYPLLKKFGIVR
jgi:DNA-binding NtrC family response regulator